MDVPLSAIVAPLPALPTLPVIVHVDAATLSEAAIETPPALAVRVAVCAEGTVAAAVAENVALAAPAPTVTLDGRVTYLLLLARVTLNPPVPAVEFKVTVQEDTPAGLTLVGVQESPVSASWEEGWLIDTLPATPTAGIGLPNTSAAVTALTWMGAELSNEPEATVNVAVAKVPSLIRLEFIPYRTHVVLVEVPEQVMLLLAAVAFAPAVTVTLEMSEDE